jgi:hypothetical protein
MVSKVLFWGGFGAQASKYMAERSPLIKYTGIAVRAYQLGIELRPMFAKQSNLWLYPVYAAIGGGFGFWLEGLGVSHNKMLQERKESLLEKRRRKLEREQAERESGSTGQTQDTAVIAGS